MNTILKQIDFIRTIYFNFKMFHLREAMKFPVFIAHHTKFVSLRGKVLIWGNLRLGMIRFGFGNVGIVDKKYNRTLIELNGILIFNGKAHFGTGSKISVGESGTLQIGERFIISAKSTIICFNSISIGSDVLLSWDILLMDNDFHEMENSLTGEINFNITKPIVIGRNTWIGTRSLILKGTKVPPNTTIAANSLLNRKYEIEENCVLAGIPAYVVKKNIRKRL